MYMYKVHCKSLGSTCMHYSVHVQHTHTHTHTHTTHTQCTHTRSQHTHTHTHTHTHSLYTLTHTHSHIHTHSLDDSDEVFENGLSAFVGNHGSSDVAQDVRATGMNCIQVAIYSKTEAKG